MTAVGGSPLSPMQATAAYDKPPPPEQPLPPPPACAARALAVPPTLRRQNASRLTWPPDPISSWTYIALSPGELADYLRTFCARSISAREVAAFFADGSRAERGADGADGAASADGRPAYVEYARAWPHEIEEALSTADEPVAAIVHALGSLNRVTTR